MADTIKCPHCGNEIEITEVLSHQVEERIKLHYEETYRKKSEEDKIKLRETLEKEIQEKSSLDITDLKKQLEEKSKKVELMMESELKLREEKRQLEEEEKELKLEVQRQLDEERKKIEETVLSRAAEDHRLKDLEKDKKIQDLMRSLDDAQRKAQLGSQQLQGEILELDLEETFRNTFTDDTIEPVGKGIRGADIRQIVKSPRGYICGVILWEMKRTKAWSNEWCGKLKDDLRNEKAHIPVIVTETMPDDIKSGFGYHDGVWVSQYQHVVPLAMILRKNLLDLGFERVKTAHKGDKADLLYEYVTSHEFQQQIEASAEVYVDMQNDLQKEKAAFERIWKKREGQILRLINSTANVVGSIQGRIGQTALQVKGLDLIEITSGDIK